MRAYSIPAGRMSAAYFACPVTFSGASIRRGELPITWNCPTARRTAFSPTTRAMRLPSLNSP